MGEFLMFGNTIINVAHIALIKFNVEEKFEVLFRLTTGDTFTLHSETKKDLLRIKEDIWKRLCGE